MQKRFGVIIPSIVDPLDYEFLNGISDAAKRLGYDILIYTGIYNSHSDLQQDSYIRGMENIYALPAVQRLDGILFAADRFHNPAVRDAIRRQLMQTNSPCLVTGDDYLPFDSIQPRQHESIYRLTKHLIRDHGCKKNLLYFGL